MTELLWLAFGLAALAVLALWAHPVTNPWVRRVAWPLAALLCALLAAAAASSATKRRLNAFGRRVPMPTEAALRKAEGWALGRALDAEDELRERRLGESVELSTWRAERAIAERIRDDERRRREIERLVWGDK